MPKNDGGPAYPGIKTSYAIPAEIADKFPELHQHIKAFETPMSGMSLRDAIAIAVLPSMISKVYGSSAIASEQAYAYADAMLVEREK